MALENLILVLGGAIFLFLYCYEKTDEQLLKAIWLMLGLGLVGAGIFLNWNLTQAVTTISYPAYQITIANSPTFCTPSPLIYSINTFFFSQDPADLSGYNYMDFSPKSSSSNTMTITTTGRYLLAKYITNSSMPNLDKVSIGNREFTLFASETAVTAQLFAQMWVTTNSGILVYEGGQSSFSPPLTTQNEQYTLNFNVNITHSINSSHRKAVFIFANVTAVLGGSKTITLYNGNINQSHTSITTQANGIITGESCPTTTEITSYPSYNAIQTMNNTYTQTYGTQYVGNAYLLVVFGIIMIIIYRMVRGLMRMARGK